MTTVINNPQGNSGGDSGLGVLAAVIIVVVIAILFFVYGLPALRNNQPEEKNGEANINIDLKTPTPPQESPSY